MAMAKGTASLKELIDLARAEGLKRLKYGNTEFEFSSSHNPSIPSNGVPIASLDDERPPSDDEMLYASSPYYDVLRAERDNASKEAS